MPVYSGKSLRAKLGLKQGSSAVFLFAPLSYIEALGDIDDVRVFPLLTQEHDLVHLFVRERKMLKALLGEARPSIKQAGAIWVSWPKKTSKVPTDITEDVIREVALPLGLVDVKVAAVDNVWSGLKLVIRLKNRLH